MIDATDEILVIEYLARRLLKDSVMRTTMTTAWLCSMLAIGCAPIGQPGHHGDDPGPDAGTQSSVCGDIVTKTMDLTLSSSTQVGNLPTSCWKLAGKLTVSGSIDSLAKLGDLRGVQDLVIDGAALKSIDTKNPLEVTRTIDIHNTTALTDLANITVPQDVTCLSYLAGVNIVGNSALTSLGGLKDLRCVSGAVTIQNNVKLAAIDFGQAKRFEGGLLVQDNTVLATMSLAQLESVTGDLVIRHNVALTSLGAMPAIKYLHGSVTIDGNTALTALPDTMGTPTPVVEGSLAITGNTALTKLGQFSHLSGVDLTINVANNTQLDFCTEARAVGCCVPHYDNQPATITGNKNNGGSCSGHSWCYAAQGNACYSYTN